MSTQKAVIFHDTSWGGYSHIPILRSVIQAGHIPIVKDSKSDKSYLNKICSAGLDIIDWDRYASPEITALAEKESLGRIEKIASILNQPNVLGHFHSPIGAFLTKTGNEFFNSLIMRIRDQIINIEIIKSIQKEYEIGLVVLGYDFLDRSRAVIEFARKEGIPTLGFTHSDTNKDPSRIYDKLVAKGRNISGKIEHLSDAMPVMYADYLCVNGQMSADRLVEWGADPARIFITGAAKSDRQYPQKTPPTDIEKTSICEKIGLDSNKPIVVAFFNYAHYAEYRYAVTSRFALNYHNAICEAAKVLEDVQFVFRPHPSEMDNLPLSDGELENIDRMYAEWLDRKGCSNIHLMRTHKDELLSVADLAICMAQSTVVHELMILGCPIVGISPHKDIDIPYERVGKTCTVRQYEELTSVVQGIISSPETREEILRNQREAIPKINYNHDGKASERIAASIQKILVHHDRNPGTYLDTQKKEPVKMDKTPAGTEKVKVLITGQRRSGTTLTANIIGGQEGVTIWRDFLHIGRILQSMNIKSVSQSLTPSQQAHAIRLFREFTEEHMHSDQIPVDELLEDLSFDTLLGLYQAVFERLSQQESNIVGHKTTMAHRTMRDLLKGMPELRILYVLRDPRDVVNSSVKRQQKEQHWDKKGPYDWAVEWADSEKELQHCMNDASIRDRIFVLKYEDLVLQPEDTLSKVGEFLGVDGFSVPEALYDFGQQWLGGSSFGELSRTLDPTPIGRWMTNNYEVGRLVEVVLKDRMLHYGYKLSRPVTSTDIIDANKDYLHHNLARTTAYLFNKKVFNDSPTYLNTLYSLRRLSDLAIKNLEHTNQE